MLPPPSDSQPTGASVALGGAALAAGAMLAGLALRRKTSLPLAAGLAAAAASLRLITKSKGEGTDPQATIDLPAAGALPKCYSSKFQVLEDGDLDDDSPGDWVDSDAVLFEHLVPAGSPLPAAPQAMAIIPSPQATSFPLLDDDGNPVSGRQALPSPVPAAFADTSAEFGFPLGPLIWEPDQSSQSCSETEGETVWFGLSDTVFARPASAKPAPSPSAGAMLLHASAPRMATSESVHQAREPAAPPESATSILESLRAEAAKRGGTWAAKEVDAPVSEPGTTMVKCSSHQEPLSFADWMLSAQQGLPPAPSSTEMVPRTPTRTTLPVARQPGVAPRSEVDGQGKPAVHEKRSYEEGERHPVMPRPLRDGHASDGSPRGPAVVFHRSVAPMAPVHLGETQGYRPLTMILAALILMVVLFAVAIWGDGHLPGKAAAPPWSQDPLPAEERVSAAAEANPVATTASPSF